MKNKSWLIENENHVQLFIKVKTHAHEDKILNIYHCEMRERLEISIRAVREKGKANESLIVFLSKILNTAKANIHIIKGTTLPLKEIAIYNASYQVLLDRLSSSMRKDT